MLPPLPAPDALDDGPLASVDPHVAARLRLVVTRLARRLRQEASEGLSPAQTAALATVERLGPLSPSELAAHERIQRPTATRVLAHLEEAALIVRERDPRDGRAARVRISAGGRRLLRRLRTRKTAYLARRLRGLPEDDLRVLERAAAILERVLEEEEAP